MVADKARLLALKLQQRRTAAPTIGYYLRANGKRHLLFIALYAAIVVLLLLVRQPWLAVGLIGFALGRQLRDLQWYRALAGDWPLVAQFIDWQKVDEFAQTPSPQTHP